MWSEPAAVSLRPELSAWRDERVVPKALRGAPRANAHAHAVIHANFVSK